MTTNIAGLVCSSCGYAFELATSIGSTVVPDEGSVSICIRCAGVDLFTKDDTGKLGLRAPTAEERADLLSRSYIVDAVAAIMLDSAWEWGISGDHGYSVSKVDNEGIARRALRMLGPGALLYRRPSTGKPIADRERPADGGWVRVR
jgi:hypothetical protein